MLVKFLVGRLYGSHWYAADSIVDVPDLTAARMVKDNAAIPAPPGSVAGEPTESFLVIGKETNLDPKTEVETREKTVDPIAVEKR